MIKNEEIFDRLLDLVKKNVSSGGWPFAAVIVKDGEVIGTGVNRVEETHDPSSHAEIDAIRVATRASKSHRLDGAEMYLVGPPCPMCMTCMIMAGIGKIHCTLDVEQKDACLTALPLTQELYDKVAVSLDGGWPEIEYHSDPSERASAVLTEWNSQQLQR